MNNMGVGCPPVQGGMDMMTLMLMLMLMYPGMFGADNSMMLLLMIMMMSGGHF